MALPSTTEELLELLDRNRWSTVAFRRHLDIEDWPMDLRLNYQTPSCPRGFQPHLQQQQLQQQLQQQVAESTEPSQLATPATTATSFRSARAVQVRINDVVAREAAVAYGKIYEHVRHTPLEPSPWLSNLVGSASGRSCVALLKLESEQHTGSFKVRGALSKVRTQSATSWGHRIHPHSFGGGFRVELSACNTLTRHRPIGSYNVFSVSVFSHLYDRTER
ncbi:hypothetical protein Vretifemale_14835 [Volvox reticuliferus]|uniref:Tryptophan synthase beta chain-like PALP domain-containing protein n=1 Tax=Volvox reticuliferus TaxID=1737510 RepID=A0A8J4CQL3_9CHLO|nr:hypothetical protein Vretifemale_14835 [Volvox reticuliferus]